MPENIAFARKASGLVRGLSVTDAFGMGLVLVLPMYGIWFGLTVGMGLFSGANLVLTTVVCVFGLGLPGVFVWGMLSGSMPRSGGEYIYNSRIIHPAVAMGASFGMVAAQLYWNIYEGSWIADPSLKILGQYMGWPGLVSFLDTRTGIVVCAAAVWAAAFLVVAFGMAIYKLIQRPIVAVTIATTASFAVILAFVSKADFVRNWDAAAVRYHSLGYRSFIDAVSQASGSALPASWNWADTFGAISAVYSLILPAMAMIYVSGEVKRPNRSLLLSNGLAVAVPGLLGVASFAALSHAVDFRFMAASAWNDLSGGVPGYNFPYSSSYMTLTFVGSGFNRFVAILLSLTWLLSTIAILAVVIIIMQRVLFAWGMDRMGPKFFTSISARRGTPIGMYAVIAGVSAVLQVVYVLWFTSAFTGLVAGGMLVVTVFAVSAVSAIAFPYRRRARLIWESSPYRTWTVAGIPIVVVAGVVYLAFVCLIVYFGFLDPKTRDVTGKNLIVFAIVWAVGMIWYFAWKRLGFRNTGFDASEVYAELPPE